MITIGGRPSSAPDLIGEFAENSVERIIIQMLSASEKDYQYDTAKELWFELTLRKEIIGASNALYRSGLRFAVFRDAECNLDYWELTPEGGFMQRQDVLSADAVRDIFVNGRKYATE
ncbi:MAG: protein-glutamine gamma-glutamyltransferase, partial [Acetanaerobacterium sp.]